MCLSFQTFQSLLVKQYSVVFFLIFKKNEKRRRYGSRFPIERKNVFDLWAAQIREMDVYERLEKERAWQVFYSPAVLSLYVYNILYYIVCVTFVASHVDQLISDTTGGQSGFNHVRWRAHERVNL